MTPKTLKTAIISYLLLQTMLLHAYVVRGTVVDNTGQPIRKATVIGRNSLKKIVIGVETDQTGNFSSADINDSTLTIEVSKADYTTVYIDISATTCEAIDLGTIQLKPKEANLNEVVVTARTIIQKPDRYIIIPSKKELQQSANGLTLLGNIQYKMPGLSVNESLQTIKADNTTPVLKINGKPCDLNHFLSLNPQHILRIEYHDNPDVRYENRRVINIILNPRGDGGSAIAGIQAGVNAGFLNSHMGIRYYSKKSEWEINYNTTRRDYHKREINSYSQFIGRDYPIVREKDGNPSDFHYRTHILSMAYTYTHNPNTVFAAKAGLDIENQKMDDNSWNKQQYMEQLSLYQNLTYKKLHFNSPNIDLFFRKQIDKTQFIEANVYARYSTGDYQRNYINIHQNLLPNDSILSLTKDNSWRIGSDFMYSKTFKSLVATVGIQEYYNKTMNDQTENGSLVRGHISQNRVSVYGQFQGKIKRLGYSINTIGIYNHAQNNTYKTDAIRMKINVVVNYPLFQHTTVNYLFMLEPSLPSVSQQSPLLLRVDEITVRQGNPDLEPSSYIRNRIYVRYADKRFTASLWASHSRTQKPVYYAYRYISNAISPYQDLFMTAPVNGKHNDHFNLELNVAAQELFGWATVWGNVGWSNFQISMADKKYTRNRLYASLNGALSFGKWLISMRHQIQPDYYLSGNSYSTDDRWNTIKVQYKHKNWQFSLTGTNLFTKRGSMYESITISDVHPETLTQNIRDNANMVLLGVNYQFDFGKKQGKTKRSLNNGGIERNIDINY